MAEVRLADIYEPLIFNGGVQEAAIEQNALLSSGVLVNDPTVSNMITGAGSIGEMPFFYGLTHDEPDYTNDDPTAKSTPAKINGGTQIYRQANQHKSWSTMDLARELALQDPLGAIASRIGGFWAANTQNRLVASALGVLADNIANGGGDMVHAAHTETGSAATADNQVNGDNVLDATQTMGDKSKSLTAVAMHSIQYNELRKQQLIAFIPNARGEVNIPTYMDLVVIVDDNMPVRAGTTDGFVYTMMLMSAGAFGYGVGDALVPSEINRIAEAGNGGGQDVIHSRTNEILHPYGYAFDSSTIAGQSATRAELQVAPAWSRVFAERKNIGLAFLTVN